MTTRDEVIEMTARMLPPLHEPLRTQAAEEWADQWLDRFTITPKASDATSPLPVVSDAAVEAAAVAIHAEGWTCEAHEPEGLDSCEQCATSTPRLARAALSAATPFLGATAVVAEDVEALRAVESEGMWEVSLRFPSESGDWRRDLVASAPSATREDVGEALHPGLFSLSDDEYARRFDNHGADVRTRHQEAVLVDEVDPLLARFTITRRTDR